MKSVSVCLFLASLSSVMCEETSEKPATEDKKKDADDKKVGKRGLWDFGFGFNDHHHDQGYGTLGGYGLGSAIGGYSGHFPHIHRHHYPTHIHTATTITKSVPVPQPYPVTVEKHVPYPVAAPYPVEVPRPYPVTVHKPYPVTVEKHIPVPVDRPYPVHVHHAYPVPVVKHVGIPVPHPYPVEVHKSSFPPFPSLPFHRPLYSDHDLW